QVSWGGLCSCTPDMLAVRTSWFTRRQYLCHRNDHVSSILSACLIASCSDLSAILTTSQRPCPRQAQEGLGLFRTSPCPSLRSRTCEERHYVNFETSLPNHAQRAGCHAACLRDLGQTLEARRETAF